MELGRHRDGTLGAAPFHFATKLSAQGIHIMRFKTLLFATLLLTSTAAQAGDSIIEGQLVIRGTAGTAATCESSDGAGDICVSSDLRADSNGVFGGTLTVTGATTLSSTLALTGDLTLSGGASALTFSGSASSVVVDDNDATALLFGSTGLLNLLTLDTTNSAETVIVTGTTTVDAFHVDVGTSKFDEGVDIATLSAMLYPVRFCGNGPNATTENYVGPVRVEDYEGAGDAPAEDDFAYGGTGCDGQDNTTIATADEALDIGPYALKATAMVCVSDCGTDDTMTAQLYDDTVAVTGMTCDITLAGAAAQCTVRDSTPATIAASSTLAVGFVNDTDDDCSGGDVECIVFFTY